MIDLLIYILVLAVIVGLIWYVLDALPVPEPLNKIVKMVVIVIACLIIVLMLLRLVPLHGVL